MKKHRNLFILLFVCFLCFVFRLGAVGLFDFNEGFYAQVAREMALRNDYVTPRFNGTFFFDKPPLALWFSALSFKLFGFSEFAARFPVAFAATALSLLTWWFGKKYFTERTALFAGCMVALNPMMIGTARQMTMDIHQSLWFAVAMFGFYVAWTSNDKKQKWMYLAISVGCGFSVLSKSVPGLFPLVCILAFIALEKKGQLRDILSALGSLKPIINLLILAAIIVPWHYFAWRNNGKIFYEEYWLLHHVQLLNGKDFNHTQPFWYYIPMLLAGLFPWSLLLPWAVRKPSTSESTVNTHRFLLTWGVVVFLIFSLMKSKLISYLLPMYAPAALLVAFWIDQALLTESLSLRRALRFATSIVTALGVLLAVAVPVVVERAKHNTKLANDLAKELPIPLLSWIQHSAILLALFGITALLMTYRRQLDRSVWALLGGMSVFMLLADTEGHAVMQSEKVGPLQSLALMAADMSRSGHKLAVHIGTPRHPSVMFYLPDDLFLARSLPDGVVENGLILEKGEIEPISEFIHQNPGGVVITEVWRADKLRTIEPGIKVVETHGRWQLIEAPESPALTK